MTSRARSRMSHSFQPGDLTISQTILEETEQATPPSRYQNDIESHLGLPQAVLIDQLRQRIADLEECNRMSISIPDFEKVQREWQTSEDLLRGSQRDNESKHETIEQYKIYVKDLEGIIEGIAGPDWKEYHHARPPLSQSIMFSASTPLPKPSAAALRRSVSILPSAKRASRSITRHASASDFGSFNIKSAFAMEGRGGGDMDDTPTGAMRRLTGKPMDPSDAKTKGTDGVQSRKPDTLLVPAESMRKPSQTPVDESLTATGVVAPPRLESAQVKTLLELLATSTAKTNGQEQNRHQQDVMSRTLAAIELAEKNARAREARLEGMLQAARSAA